MKRSPYPPKRLAQSLFAAASIVFVAQQFAMCADLSSLPGETPESKEAINTALTIMKTQRPQAAIPYLQQAITQFPNSPALHFELGNALCDVREYQTAISEYQTGLNLRNNFPEALLNIAYAYCNLGQNGEAVVWFERFIKENPHSPKLQQVQMQMLQAAAAESLQQNRAYDAKKLLERALLLNPKDASAHFKLARACDELGDTKRAIAEYQQVLQIQPSHAAAVFNIAGCYQSMGLPDQAIVWFRKYLQNNPNAHDAQTVKNMIVKLQEAGKQPHLDPRNPDFFESVVDRGKPYRWAPDKLPLRIFVADGRQVQGFRMAYAKALFDSITAWSQASQNKIAFRYVQSANDADIVFNWTGNPFDVRQTAGDVEQGICRLQSNERPSDGFNRIEHADLRILTLDRETLKPISDDDMKKTCLHELGHALGLHGHSTNNHDIMFFSVSPTVWPVLSKRDKATLLKIYEPYAPLMASY